MGFLELRQARWVHSRVTTGMPILNAKLSVFGGRKGEWGQGGWGVRSPPPPPCRQVGTPSVVADRGNFKEWAVRVCHKGRVCELSGIRPLMGLQLSSPN